MSAITDQQREALRLAMELKGDVDLVQTFMEAATLIQRKTTGGAKDLVLAVDILKTVSIVLLARFATEPFEDALAYWGEWSDS